MNWLQVTLELQPDLAEPAAELLGRHAPHGVAVELVGSLARVRAWLAEDESLPTTQRQIEVGLWHLGQIQPFPEPSYELVENEDWEEVWKSQYRPIQVGERLQILPAWMENEPKSDGERIELYLEPGMAFGTGTHTTTRHCLEALERQLRTGDNVADLGCGSGILAIAAALLGAAKVYAVDIDQKALELSRENIRRNGVQDRVRVLEGSLAALPSGQFELVVANIRASVLETLFSEGMAGRVSDGGLIVLSGILEEQAAAVVRSAKAAELELAEVRSGGDWRTLEFRK